MIRAWRQRRLSHRRGWAVENALRGPDLTVTHYYGVRDWDGDDPMHVRSRCGQRIPIDALARGRDLPADRWCRRCFPVFCRLTPTNVVILTLVLTAILLVALG